MTLSNQYIQFSLSTDDGDSVLRIDAPRVKVFPIPIEIKTEVAFSVVGSPLINGDNFDHPLMWQGVSLVLEFDDWITLNGLIRRQEYQRQNQLDFAITFDNVLDPLVERNATQTRAIASGTTTTTADNLLYYYAQHNVAIINIDPSREGHWYMATLTLQELDFTTP